jgi:transposase
MRPSDPQPHDWKEWRRIRALELAELGWKQHTIALALDASEGSVSKWLARAEHGGPQALRARPRLGPVAKITDEQFRRIPDFLWHGPEAYGFRGNVWTCERVVGVLAEELHVSYSKSQVSRILKDLGWTPQIPITRAIQRDEATIERWRLSTWPALKQKARRLGLDLIFWDESGFYLLPSVVKTYAPRGHTPILSSWQTRDHLSIMGAVTPEGKVYSLVREDSLNGLHTIEFLRHLIRQRGDHLLVIWDNSPIHRRAEVQAFLAQAAHRHIHVEALPSYAPDLNPVEWLWQHVKDVELHNLTCLDLEQLHMELHLALGRTRQRTELVQSFFEAAGLKL